MSVGSRVFASNAKSAYTVCHSSVTYFLANRVDESVILAIGDSSL
jgi:hypothetical protein